MGHMRRQEAREAAEALEKENVYLGEKTLGHICAAGIVTLKVSCMNCTRRGQYRVTRMIDRHGASMRLLDLKTILAGDCRYRLAWPVGNRCSVYYPGISRHVIKPLL